MRKQKKKKRKKGKKQGNHYLFSLICSYGTDTIQRTSKSKEQEEWRQGVYMCEQS